jgi:hypothetical protein
MREALLVAAHGPARLFGLRQCDGRLRYAYDQSPEQAQHQGRVGLAHTAAVLVQGNVQRMVQPAFDDPIAALEFVSHGYLIENGRVVMHDTAEAMKKNPDIQEFYLGGEKGRDFREIKHYRRRKRWLS